ncbi:hypothetical protein DPMN_038607 [Dreissena polymorpha]|uniref:Uncharacterized protein n=1 Tax=Dreissena polymorpha TaxID=45954 RepID=A0A9D4MFT2_DREPO|nr:hypothetical protein DPMN_038607 [Dreissena polymorpha]
MSTVNRVIQTVKSAQELLFSINLSASGQYLFFQLSIKVFLVSASANQRSGSQIHADPTNLHAELSFLALTYNTAKGSALHFVYKID